MFGRGRGGCSRYMHGMNSRSPMTNRPSHYDAWTEHVGLVLTRQKLLAPSVKRHMRCSPSRMEGRGGRRGWGGKGRGVDGTGGGGKGEGIKGRWRERREDVGGERGGGGGREREGGKEGEVVDG